MFYKMKKLFKLKYPKIIGLIITIIIAYFIFSNPLIKNFVNNLEELSYLGIFIFGILFSFGFTSAFAVGFFIVFDSSNIFLMSFIGGLGALFSDLVIFKIIRFSFMDEFKKIKKTKIFFEINKKINESLGYKLKLYLMYVFAGIFIASPFPDEIGIIMLAGLTKIKTLSLAIISIILNTLGIFILLSL